MHHVHQDELAAAENSEKVRANAKCAESASKCEIGSKKANAKSERKKKCEMQRKRENVRCTEKEHMRGCEM